MKRIQSFRRALIIVSLFTVSMTTIVSAATNILDGLWFKLKLSTKGEQINPISTAVSKVSFSAPVYANFVGTPTNHMYTIHYWSQSDAGWTNSYSGPAVAEGTNDCLFSLVFANLDVAGGTSLGSYHTIFIDPKLTSTDTVKSATYTSLGGLVLGNVTNGPVPMIIFGSATISGSSVSSNKLPFTP
jgi:hypothetical protein